MDIETKLKWLNFNSWYGLYPRRKNMIRENRICSRCKKQIIPILSDMKEIKVSEASTTVNYVLCKAYLCDDCWNTLNKWLAYKEQLTW